MQGKTVLITGGTSGIGKETAVGLAALGASIVITGRDKTRGEAAVADIKARTGNPNVSVLLSDLAVQSQIHQLAETFTARYPRLDVLINNVGGLYRERWLTADGIEASFAVNHLTPFLLTHLLLPVLKASAPSRVINVTGGMPNGKIDLDNLQAEKSYLGLRTYSHAKAVMMAVSYEFAQRLAGTGVALNVAYPGAASTDMTTAMTPDMLPGFMRVMYPLFTTFMSNAKPEKAARSSIYLASSPEVDGVTGQNFNTNSKPAKWSAEMLNPALRQQLWAISERLTQLDTQVVPA